MANTTHMGTLIPYQATPDLAPFTLVVSDMKAMHLLKSKWLRLKDS